MSTCVCVPSHVQLFVTPGTVACQDPLSMKFSRQEYWSRLPFPTPGDFTNPWIELASLLDSPELAGGFFTATPPGKPIWVYACRLSLQLVQLFASLWTIACQAPLHGILQVRILEWVAIFFSRGSSQPRDQTSVSGNSCTGRQVLYN